VFIAFITIRLGIIVDGVRIERKALEAETRDEQYGGSISLKRKRGKIKIFGAGPGLSPPS
jgi:hypothetical protein